MNRPSLAPLISFTSSLVGRFPVVDCIFGRTCYMSFLQTTFRSRLRLSQIILLLSRLQTLNEPLASASKKEQKKMTEKQKAEADKKASKKADKQIKPKFEADILKMYAKFENFFGLVVRQDNIDFEQQQYLQSKYDIAANTWITDQSKSKDFKEFYRIIRPKCLACGEQ